jgi:hypothetical protein
MLPALEDNLHRRNKSWQSWIVDAATVETNKNKKYDYILFYALAYDLC